MWEISDEAPDAASISAMRWFAEKKLETLDKLEKSFDSYRISEALMISYKWVWDDFCNWYLEAIKPAYGAPISRAVYKQTITFFEELLTVLHPFMPFITEEIWDHLPGVEESLMVAQWPEPDSISINEPAEEKMELVMDIIGSIRNIRNEMKVNPGKEITAILTSDVTEKLEILEEGADYIANLANVEELKIAEEIANEPDKASTAITSEVKVILPLADLVDIDKEISRLEDEIDEMKSEIERAKGKLANEGFVNNAPDHLVEEEREKKEEYTKKKEQLVEKLAELKE
jgi:valyl-tRNA synthetase